MQLAIKSMVFPGLIFLMTIIGVSSNFFGNPSDGPTKILSTSHVMSVNIRVQLNTQKQLLLFLINTLSLSVLLLYLYLSILPIFSWYLLWLDYCIG